MRTACARLRVRPAPPPAAVGVTQAWQLSGHSSVTTGSLSERASIASNGSRIAKGTDRPRSSRPCHHMQPLNIDPEITSSGKLHVCVHLRQAAHKHGGVTNSLQRLTACHTEPSQSTIWVVCTQRLQPQAQSVRNILDIARLIASVLTDTRAGAGAGATGVGCGSTTGTAPAPAAQLVLA